MIKIIKIVLIIVLILFVLYFLITQIDFTKIIKQECSDGTLYGMCSITKPMYCDKGNLIEKCITCSCEDGYECKEDGNCYAIQLCDGEICPENKECINDKCMLKYTPYKLGIVYVYNTPETYNSNWRNEIGEITLKVENSLKEVTDNKIDASIEILGEIQTDIFCWNPAKAGGKFRNIKTGGEFYFRMPCSGFCGTGIGLTGYEITESYCDNCIIQDDIYTMDCPDVFSYNNTWRSNKLNELNQQISQNLGINFSDYDGIFIIFGKLGNILPEESLENLEYRCQGIAGVIGGYSNLIMSENSIKSGGFVNCTQVGEVPYYDKMGWHIMVHEILHRFGTVDVYETGTVYGIETYREEALKIDPKTDESIMGNEDRNCIDRGGYEIDGNICTIEELERVYLDKYNRQKIGLE